MKRSAIVRCLTGLLGLTGLVGPVRAAGERAEAYYHFSLAQQARIQADRDGALLELRRALKLAPASGEIHTEIAGLLRETGRLDEAQVEAEQAVALAPLDAAAHRVLARVYRDQAHATIEPKSVLQKAAGEFEAVVKLDPADGQSLTVLMTVYNQLGNPAGAAKALERYVELDPNNADAYLRLGRSYLASGNPEGAAGALKRALDLRPDSSQAYATLGDVNAETGQSDQAIFHYRKALEFDSNNFRLRMRLGDVLMGARRFAEARDEADVVLDVDPRSAPALDLRGRALRELKDYDGAWEAAERILKDDADDLRAVYLEVTIAEARRDFALAAEVIERIRPRLSGGQPGSARNGRIFFVHLGFAYQRLGRFDEAVDAFAQAKASSRDPDAVLWGYHGEALLRAKDPRALEVVQEGRARFPDNNDLVALEAVIRQERGDHAGARAIIEVLQSKAPDDPDVLLQVADFHQRGRHYGPAVEVLRKVRVLEPRNVRMLFQLGAVLERSRRFDEAEEVFRAALQVEPDSAPVLNYLGYMNAHRNVSVEDALALIDRALVLDPENGAYLDSKGWALFRLGRLADAEGHARRAIEKEPRNAVVLEHLADILHELGSLEEAVEFWRRALKGDDDEEFDRAAVELKISRAQSALDTRPQP